MLQREKDWSSNILLFLFIICFLVKYFLGKKLSSTGIRKETQYKNELVKTDSKVVLAKKKKYENCYENFAAEDPKCWIAAADDPKFPKLEYHLYWLLFQVQLYRSTGGLTLKN